MSDPSAAESAAPCNVARFLPDMAERQPEALALRVPRGRGPDGSIRYFDLSFAGLDAEADAWAHRLTQGGILRGSRVLLLVRPGLSLIAICFALFKIGAVPVVIDPGMGLRAFLRCVRRTTPDALVAITRGIWLARLFRRTFSGTRFRVRVDPDRPLAPPTGAGRPRPARFPVAPTRADELAAILFTSGSTGAAKGVCYEHGMFEAQVRTLRQVYGIAPGEVDLPMLPVFALFNPALGMTTVVPEIDPSRPASVDPARIVQAIRQSGVTNSFGSPTLWRKIGDFCRREGVELPTVRRVLSAGAPVPPQLMADLRRVLPRGTVHSPYGATEALPVCTVTDREILEEAAALSLPGRGTCLGRPVAGLDLRIIRLGDDPIARWENSLVLPAGEVGEIVVRGPQVTRTYDRLPEATAASKIEDPDGTDACAGGGPRRPALWHRMGDCGYLDAEGRLWFCGRKAERVVSARRTWFTDCCEGVFNQHPRVARTALIGRGAPGMQEPALVVEPKAGRWPLSPLERADFAQELRALGAACEPTRDIHLFFFHRRFPVDVRHNAKIHRLSLARYFAPRRPLRLP